MIAKRRARSTAAATGGLKRLLKRARAGDITVLPALQCQFDQRPQLWQSIADLVKRIEAELIDLAAGDDLALRESLRRKLDELRVRLGYERADSLEVLLIDRVVLTWLRALYTDALYARASDPTSRLGKLLADHSSRAEQDHLHAIERLAVVRQLIGSTKVVETASGPAA